jgi:hypothetical protein
MVQFGATRSCSASATRIGLSALVTIRRTNVSVDTSATVSPGPLVTPALTNSKSNVARARRSCNAATCSGTVISTASTTRRPSEDLARSCSPVRRAPRTVAVTRQPRARYSAASA